MSNFHQIKIIFLKGIFISVVFVLFGCGQQKLARNKVVKQEFIDGEVMITKEKAADRFDFSHDLGSRELREGSKGEDVALLQERLRMAGFTNYQFNQGIFDYLTRKALIEYQSGQNPFLKEVLGFSPSDKMEANGIADVGLCRHIIKKTGYYSKLLIYQINYGDTLSAISGRFKIAVKDLILLNNITKEGFIKTGQKIFILIRPDSSLEKSYKIKAGESLEMIANRFQIPLDDLIKSNCLFISGTIKTGELLYIPGRPQDM